MSDEIIPKNLKECHETELEWKVINGRDHIFEGAQCRFCETIYERRNTGKVIYVHRKGEGDYFCGTCDSEILSVTVAHPIHDGPFPLSGSGKCQYEEVPYCSNCEEEPDSHGSIITRKEMDEKLKDLFN